MDGRIALEAAFVLEVSANGRDLAEPGIEVFEESRLVVVDDDGGIRMQRGNRDDAVTEAAFLHRGFHLRSEVEDFAGFLRLNCDVLAVCLHGCSSGEAAENAAVL